MNGIGIRNLTARHGQLPAVRDLTLNIRRGEVLALVGANGAGKTTLLRTIAGAHRPAAGAILLDGRDITVLPSHARNRLGIALVPEGRRLFGAMTVEENLLLGGSGGRPGPWTVSRVMATFPNLAKRLRAKAGTLSGGEQQATAIGRALMSNPDILLLDEVSLGLSPLVVDQVYASLSPLIASGLTVVLVEQDLTRALGVASRVVCMLEGRRVLENATADVTREQVTNAYFGLSKGTAT